mmetsp:Transcript_8365/g.12224  ORF Transcript_8365/g.12224 Transcript_8365/m.12224 type:complete len:297 (+) Transcript_8365:48-938(+)
MTISQPKPPSSITHQRQPLSNHIQSTTRMNDNTNRTSSNSDYYAAADEESSSPASPPLSWSFADVGKTRLISRDNSQHATDEVFNSLSHLSACMLSILGTTLLIARSSSPANAWKIVSFSIYGASLIFLFGCSTLHHAINASAEVEARLRMLDYLAIYPLIAGTFTPFCLVFLHDSVIGWSFLGVAWLLSAVGMIMTAKFGPELIPKWMSMTMYITIGWLGGFLALYIIPYIGLSGLFVFVLGGVCYTVGGYVYSSEQPNPYPGKFGFHEIWHCFVILAAFFHFAVMFWWVVPWQP